MTWKMFRVIALVSLNSAVSVAGSLNVIGSPSNPSLCKAGGSMIHTGPHGRSSQRWRSSVAVRDGVGSFEAVYMKRRLLRAPAAPYHRSMDRWLGCKVILAQIRGVQYVDMRLPVWSLKQQVGFEASSAHH